MKRSSKNSINKRLTSIIIASAIICSAAILILSSLTKYTVLTHISQYCHNHQIKSTFIKDDRQVCLLPPDALDKPIEQLNLITSVAVIFPILAGIIVLIYIKYAFIKPLYLLKNGVEKIKKGQLNYRLDIKTNDEIGMLAQTFNQMSQSIQNSNINLEGKVEDTTVQLKQKVKQLNQVLKEEKNLKHQLQKEKQSVEKRIEDRTKKLQAQQEDLAEEHARLNTSIDSLHAGIVMTDKKGKIVHINKILFKILGINSEAKANVQLNNWIHFKDQTSQVIKSKKTEGPSIHELDGNHFHVVTTPVKTSPDDSNVVGTVTLIEDISQRIQAEKLKDEFFAMASHELRTPLTAIKGNAMVLDQMYRPKLNDETFNDTLKDITKATSRLIKMVSDFLDMSRLESGRITMSYTTFDPVNLAQQTMEELEELAKEKNLKLTHNSKPKKLKLLADRDRVRQVLVNLIGNSIKFTDKGKITISVSKVKYQKQDHIKFTVTDTGAGMTKTQQKKVFNKFEQGRNDTQTVKKGSGLGLYISKLLVKEMGGDIEIEKSIPGKGSTFSFMLPAEN